MQTLNKISHCKMAQNVTSSNLRASDQLNGNNSHDQKSEMGSPSVIIKESQPWEDCYLFRKSCFNSHYIDPRSPIGMDNLIRTNGFVRYFLKKLTDFTSQEYAQYCLPVQTTASPFYSWLVNEDDPVAFAEKETDRNQTFFIDFRRQFDAHSVDLYWSYFDISRLPQSYCFNAVILTDSFPNLETTGPITFVKFNSTTKSFTYLDPLSDADVTQRFLFIDVNKFPETDQSPFLIWCKAICNPSIFLDESIRSQMAPGLQVLFIEMQQALHVSNCWLYLMMQQEEIAEAEVRLLNGMRHLWDCSIKQLSFPKKTLNYDPTF